MKPSPKSDVPRPNKSTNVRLLAAAIRAASLLAPTAVERWVAKQWRTPRRPKVTREPAVPWLPAHRFTLTDGPWELAAWEWGEGPTVLLVHGWNGCAAQLQAFVAPLVANGLHVVAFELPAHGQSSGREVTLPEMAAAVSAVAHRFGPLHAVIAHSLGATATVLALAGGVEAKKVALIAPPAEMKHFARGFGQLVGLTPSGIEGLFRRIREYVKRDLESFDLRRVAPTLSVPALVMHDLADREVPFEHSRAIVEAWPGAKLNVLEGMGHRGALRDPGALAQVVSFVTGFDTKELPAASRPVLHAVPMAS